MFYIKENDGLPQIVCMRCLGTLEFLCDFHERCHLTQKEFSGTVPSDTEEKFQRESDIESDKENAVPSMNDAKRKTKTLSPAISKIAKNCLAKHNAYYKSEKTNNVNNTRCDNNDRTNDVQSAAYTKVPLENLISNHQSKADNIVVREKNSKNEQNNGTKMKYRRNFLSNNNISKNAMNCIGRAASTIDSMHLLRKNEMKVNAHSMYPVRKRGRKSKLEKMREAGLLKRKMQNVDDKKNNDSDNKCKRYCLRRIPTTTKFNDATVNAVISSKPQVEQVTSKKQVVTDSSLNDTCIKDGNTEIARDNCILFDKPREIKLNGDNLKRSEDCLREEKDNSSKSKAISVIVKQEKLEFETTFPRYNEKVNKLTWIPSEILMQENVNLMDGLSKDQLNQQETELLQLNSLLRKEADNIKDSEATLSMEHNTAKYSNSSDLKLQTFAEQAHVTVMKSSLSNEITIPKVAEKDSLELCDKVDTSNQSTKENIKSNLSDQLLSKQYNGSNISYGSKEQGNSKDKFFGKISELISEEEKQAIETYYTVDMAIVNSEEVQKNLTVVDKKNVRCNICGIFYLRVDKCQVHIWGHLQMKPYQCKACNFATVTVTNIRSHIRKSHLKIKPFACHLCEKRYATAFLLEEHINTHTGARPYKCKLCDFSTSRRQMLSYHTSTHKAVKDINCKICGKEFYSKSRLRAHMIVHNKDKVVVCKLCSAYLSNQEALETHHRNVHMQDYVCNVCGKSVKSKKALHNHQNVHAAAKYKCSLCPNVYKSSQILKEHLLKHKGIRNYKCTICEKAFGQQSHLAAHMAVHSEIRFHCPGCDKPFNRHDNMKIHTKRCKTFLANPNLKNVCIKRERSTSFTRVTEVTNNLGVENTSTPLPAKFVESQNNELSIKAVDGNQEKTALNFCKLGLNISCIEPIDKTWNYVDLYDKAEVTRPTEISVIQITQVNDKLIPESENLTVLENVLRPESF